MLDSLVVYACLYIVIGLFAAWAAESFELQQSFLGNAGITAVIVLFWPLMLVAWMAFFVVVAYQTIVDTIKGRM